MTGGRSSPTPAVGEALVAILGPTGSAKGVDSRFLAAEGLTAGLAKHLGSARLVTSDRRSEARMSESAFVRGGSSAPTHTLIRRLPQVAEWRSATDARGSMRVGRGLGVDGWGSPSWLCNTTGDSRTRAFGSLGRSACPRSSVSRRSRSAKNTAGGSGGPVGIVSWSGVVSCVYSGWPSSVVASVSDVVDAELARARALPASNRIVLPNGVDDERFSPAWRSARARDELGARGRLLVGWVGGSRPFHGLICSLRSRLASGPADPTCGSCF